MRLLHSWGQPYPHGPLAAIYRGPSQLPFSRTPSATKVFSSASAVPSAQHASPSLLCFLLLLFSLILPRLTQSVSHFQIKRSHTLDTHIFLYVSSLMSKCSYVSIFGKSTTQFPDVTHKVDGSRCFLLGQVWFLTSCYQSMTKHGPWHLQGVWARHETFLTRLRHSIDLPRNSRRATLNLRR